jgi:O-antigen/teichoic acid export membrane protein
LLGMQAVGTYNLVDLFSKALPVVLIGSLIASGRATVPWVYGATLIALFFSFVWLYLAIVRNIGAKPTVSVEFFRQNIRYALRAYLAAFFCFLVLRADLLLIQHMLGQESAGYYSVAAAMADIVSLGAVTIGTILFPKLSAIANVQTKLQMTWRAVIVTGIITAPLIAISAVLSPWIIRLFFGDAFAQSASAYNLLLPGIFLLGLHSVAVQFLNSIGYPISVVIVWAVASVLNIAGNLWAIPRYGIQGASVVSSICYSVAFFAIALLLCREGRLHAQKTEASQ